MRPVVCVIEHLHRDRDVAEAVAAGRFTHAGETRALGVVPDWLGSDLPADEEWRIEWVKFYYGLDLAHAFRATGEERFREAWELLVASWIRQVPPDHDSSDVTGRRILNWIYAWQALQPTALDALLEESLAAQTRHVRATLTPERNHRTLELYALLLAALAVPGLDGDGELHRFALAELDRNLAEDFRADGVHREASTHYHMVALRSFLGVRANARRFGLALPDGFEDRLARASAFARHCTARTAGSRRCRTPTAAATRSCSRSPTSCSAPPARRTPGSPTAATSCSAAAGTRTRASACSTAAR